VLVARDSKAHQAVGVGSSYLIQRVLLFELVEKYWHFQIVPPFELAEKYWYFQIVPPFELAEKYLCLRTALLFAVAA
jgi:hypothetical protein